MAKVIELRFPATCRDCGAELPVGSKAKWYGKGRVYGLTCHEKPATRSFSSGGSMALGEPDESLRLPHEPLGQTMSRYDRFGLYTAAGERIATSCGCIDYPCCGH